MADSLKTTVGQIIGPDGGKTMVLEQGGSSIISKVQPKDPFRKEQCRWKETCNVSAKDDCIDSEMFQYRVNSQVETFSVWFWKPGPCYSFS